MKRIIKELKDILNILKYYKEYRDIDKPYVYQDDLSKYGNRQVYAQISSANILGALVTHNGVKGGDAGCGGFVEITLINEAGTAWDGRMYRDQFGGLEKISFRVQGDCERNTIIRAFEQIVKELKNNGNKLIN